MTTVKNSPIDPLAGHMTLQGQTQQAEQHKGKDVIPWSLFLYSHLLPSSVSSLSWPKAAFTKPFTKEEARFMRAEST